MAAESAGRIHSTKRIAIAGSASIESKVFDRSFREVHQAKNNLTGAYTVQLADDMQTVINEPKLVVPAKTKGTDFEGHAFFEAASIRKLKGKYYFIYSSRNNHELCYAISDKPDEGFVYGGTIVSNGDIGYQRRKKKDRLNLTGNNHGSIVQIGDKYFIFYHRMTDRSTYSRQACAEEIHIAADGSIAQVPVTSCGLNGAPLPAKGVYPAAIACVLTNGHMPHLTNGKISKALPYIAHKDGRTMIEGITNGTLIGFRSFRFDGDERLRLEVHGNFHGKVQIFTDIGGEQIASFPIDVPKKSAAPESLSLKGDYSIYIKFNGTGKATLTEIAFI